jgi:polyhydroxyalkanoate depolymerase
MMYAAYQAQQDLLAPFRAWSEFTSLTFRDTLMGPAANQFLRTIAAGAELFSRAKVIHERPDYDIKSVVIDGSEIAVREEIAFKGAFGDLLHFRKETDIPQPRVLIVAPMAGHFPTLLRHTAQTMLPDHDVYITDWKSARDVPKAAGRFGMDEYIAHLIAFIEAIGPGGHTVAVCQPCAALLAAVSIMAEDNNPATPRSMTLMAGPIDTRINPTKVNDFATSRSLSWFEENCITVVPGRYDGAGRRVYPGFLQLTAFMSMNMPRHMRAHIDLYGDIVSGHDAKAQVKRDFYDEYLAVADLPAEFYLETVSRVFQEHLLPKAQLKYRGRRVDPSLIRKTALLTIEGERDDICAIGQTMAAHDLCSGIKPFRKKHYVQAGAGHYGVFSGTRWQNQIYPIVRNMILASE